MMHEKQNVVVNPKDFNYNEKEFNGLYKSLLLNIKTILREINQRSLEIKKIYPFSTKTLSTMLSEMAENYTALHMLNAIAPQNDNKSDVIINGKGFEIKISKYRSNNTVWVTGKQSNRNSDFMLIKYDYDIDGNFIWFVIITHLDESNWTPQKKYGPKINLTYILENKPYKILIGDTRKANIHWHSVCQSIN